MVFIARWKCTATVFSLIPEKYTSAFPAPLRLSDLDAAFPLQEAKYYS